MELKAFWRAVQSRSITPADAWVLLEQSTWEAGQHPDVHVLRGPLGSDREAHFRERKPRGQAKPYHERKFHSLFPSPLDQAEAVAATLNTKAAGKALALLTGGTVTINSRSGAVACATMQKRMRLGGDPAREGITWFHRPVAHVVVVLRLTGEGGRLIGRVSIVTCYPSDGDKNTPPVGFDAVVASEDHVGGSALRFLVPVG